MIRARLSKAFDVRRFIKIGSSWKGTAIAGHSDVDLLVVVSRDDARWGDACVASSTLLNRARTQLRDRFPATPYIRRDGQAVSVVFTGGGPGVDVVLGLYDQPVQGGFPGYLIPDGNGGWLRSSPDKQKRYFDDEDRRWGGKLRRAVQLVKWWSEARTTPLPLRAYHLEMLLASSAIGRGPCSYSEIMYEAFYLLTSRGGAALVDPLGISGRIPLTRTELQRDVLAQSANYAWQHVQAAVEAEKNGDLSEAVRQWRVVFVSFPP
jgi:hypothetical protein